LILQRKSDYFLSFIAIAALLSGLMFIDAAVSRRLDEDAARERREIVRVLSLTDLCLFTEARYTRHPSMADLHTPFQDHPLSLDHFPSGAIMALPPHLNPRTRQ
jgi:hypothetical protein